MMTVENIADVMTLQTLADRMDDYASKLSWEVPFDDIEETMHAWAIMIRSIAEGKMPAVVQQRYVPASIYDE